MFDKPLATNWLSLNAPQVPHLLQVIQDAGEKSSEYQKAFVEINELIYPEGIMDNWDWGGPRRMMQNELPHRIIPYLLEILSNAQSWSRKAALVDLLREASCYYYVRKWISPNDTDLDRIAFDGWTQRLVGEVRKGIPIYETLLQDENEYVRSRVKELFKTLTEVSGDI